MRNVVPRRALARRSRSFLTYAFFLALFGILMLVIGVGLFIVPLVVTSNPNYALYDLARQVLIAVGVLFILLAIGLGIRAVTWRTDNALAESTGEALADFLDDDYLFVRNVSRRALGYIDAVLIGPPGALIFRIVDKDGVYYNQGRQWMQQRDNQGTHGCEDTGRERHYTQNVVYPSMVADLQGQRETMSPVRQAPRKRRAADMAREAQRQQVALCSWRGRWTIP